MFGRLLPGIKTTERVVGACATPVGCRRRTVQAADADAALSMTRARYLLQGEKLFECVGVVAVVGVVVVVVRVRC